MTGGGPGLHNAVVVGNVHRRRGVLGRGHEQQPEPVAVTQARRDQAGALLKNPAHGGGLVVDDGRGVNALGAHRVAAACAERQDDRLGVLVVVVVGDGQRDGRGLGVGGHRDAAGGRGVVAARRGSARGRVGHGHRCGDNPVKGHCDEPRCGRLRCALRALGERCHRRRQFVVGEFECG